MDVGKRRQRNFVATCPDVQSFCYRRNLVVTDDVFRLIGFIQDDLRRSQAQLVTVRAMLAANPSLVGPERKLCRHCGLTFKGSASLGDHLHVTHGMEVA
jgi:hypothetical protein